MTVEKRGACDCCGLCMVGVGLPEANWARPYDGKPAACAVTGFQSTPKSFRKWPERWEQAVEGCHITFWVNGRRILGKRPIPGGWLYPSLEVTADA